MFCAHVFRRAREICVMLSLGKFKTFVRHTKSESGARAENAMKLSSRTTFPPPKSGKEKGTRENDGEVMRKTTSNSFSDEVALFHEGEYLEKLREFRALVLRRIRAHIDDEDEKEEEEEEEKEEENEDD